MLHTIYINNILSNLLYFLCFGIHQDVIHKTEKLGQSINYEKPKCWP